MREKVEVNENTRIFWTSAMIAAIVDIAFIVLSILNIVSYKIAVSYLIGVLIGNALHYLTIRVIEKTPVDLYKTVVTKLAIIKQFIYILLLVGIYLTSKNLWAFIASVGGLTTIRLAIVVFYLSRKKHE